MGNTVQNGKGSKSRITNKRIFDKNFDNIDWIICCFECGMPLKKYKLDELGNKVCRRECNYN